MSPTGQTRALLEWQREGHVEVGHWAGAGVHVGTRPGAAIKAGDGRRTTPSLGPRCGKVKAVPEAGSPVLNLRSSEALSRSMT
jgi:hypothetical protein